MIWSFVSGVGRRRDEGDVTRAKKEIFEGSWVLLQYAMLLHIIYKVWYTYDVHFEGGGGMGG